MEPTDAPALVDVLADYDSLVEVGIGTRTWVAEALADRGATVRATDVTAQQAPHGVSFVRDDVTAPDRDVYAGADAIYALRLPPELQRPVRDVAGAVGADLYFTTLGGDPAILPAEARTVREGTVFVVPSSE